MKATRLAIAALIAIVTASSGSAAASTAEVVHLDDRGVIRWNADEREVALFGANYCLPSSGDYRAAGYVGADRKQLIEQDVAHFARMGWNGLRLALWGDWENSDREGNLIVNEHLDLLDYLLFQAKQRGISMLLTPIHRHSALWPDGKDSDAIQGFSKYYPPSELGTNPAAIAAQQNYLRQLLRHVNPYTGVALKDEPAILFVELINEPDHHSADRAGSISYINALVDAVRSTGCEKILFHNLSQDFAMAPMIAASKAQGFSFGWYPTGLVSGHTLQENYLRWVDEYSPLKSAGVPAMPRIVYEFDSADMTAAYMYPAMARSFRQVGAQFAAMFAYDMLATAPYNLGWQTHYLNLVYSPNKAVSSIIAAEVMRTLPRGQDYGTYPANRKFGPFRVSYEENSSEMVTAEKFIYANDTQTRPAHVETLKQIIGCGSSPLVSYEGRGSYFLDRLDSGLWRLEVYPDAVFVQDPFAQRLNHKTVSSRLVWRSWLMQLSLPDLGENFSIKPLNAGNTHRARAQESRFEIRPGVYLLAAKQLGDVDAARLSQKVGAVGLTEFVCPGAPDLPPQTVWPQRDVFTAGQPLSVDVDVIAASIPRTLILHAMPEKGRSAKAYPMAATRGFGFHASIPAGDVPAGTWTLWMTPAESDIRIGDPWTLRVAPALEPVILFDSANNTTRPFAMRLSGDHSGNYFDSIAATGGERAALRLKAPDVANAVTPRVVSWSIKQRIGEHREVLDKATMLRITARGAGSSMTVALVESDGSAWGHTLSPTKDWRAFDVRVRDLALMQASKLPLGYPGNWNHVLVPPANRGGLNDHPNLQQVEHLQIRALRNADETAQDSAVEIASVELLVD